MVCPTWQSDGILVPQKVNQGGHKSILISQVHSYSYLFIYNYIRMERPKHTNSKNLHWLAFALLIVTVFFVFSSYDFSFILTLAVGLQCFGFAMVYITTQRTGDLSGISWNTFCCCGLALFGRLASILSYEVVTHRYNPRAIYLLMHLEIMYTKYSNSRAWFCVSPYWVRWKTPSLHRIRRSMNTWSGTIWLLQH